MQGRLRPGLRRARRQAAGDDGVGAVGDDLEFAAVQFDDALGEVDAKARAGGGVVLGGRIAHRKRDFGRALAAHAEFDALAGSVLQGAADDVIERLLDAYGVADHPAGAGRAGDQEVDVTALHGLARHGHDTLDGLADVEAVQVQGLLAVLDAGEVAHVLDQRFQRTGR